MPRSPPPVPRSAPSAFPFVGKGCKGEGTIGPSSGKAINIEIQPREFPKFTAPEDSAVSFPRRARARARFRSIHPVFSKSRDRHRRSAGRSTTSNLFSDASDEQKASRKGGTQPLPDARFVFVRRVPRVSGESGFTQLRCRVKIKSRRDNPWLDVERRSRKTSPLIPAAPSAVAI